MADTAKTEQVITLLTTADKKRLDKLLGQWHMNTSEGVRTILLDRLTEEGVGVRRPRTASGRAVDRDGHEYDATLVP